MISVVLWASFFLTLLGTLVMRLHITFKDSAMRMTRNTVNFFKILFVIESILSILLGIGFAMSETIMDIDYSDLVFLPGTLFWFFYLIGSVLAVRLFVLNLFELTRSQ